jgi:putative ABC transport system ATP-binding protein
MGGFKLDTPLINLPSLTNLQAIAPMIELRNLSKIYGMGATTIFALKTLNLTIETGEYCSIMGASGSGKSTLMNIIGCLDQPTSGDYLLNGEYVATLSDRQLAVIRNQNIGFVFQQFHLLPQLSALDNVILPMIYGNVPPQERRDRAVSALTRVGLADRLYNRPNQLSGGQQQRVAIARALVNEPLLLLADEPTGALDSRTTQEILDLFGELHQSGMGVVMVTHEIEVANQTPRIIWLKDGEVIHSHLTPAEMRTVTMTYMA